MIANNKNLSSALAGLVQLYVHSINEPGVIPNVQSAWEQFVETKCSDVIKDALNAYEDTMSSKLADKLPCDNDRLLEHHAEALGKSEAYFMGETAGISMNRIERLLQRFKVRQEFNFRKPVFLLIPSSATDVLLFNGRHDRGECVFLYLYREYFKESTTYGFLFTKTLENERVGIVNVRTFRMTFKPCRSFYGIICLLLCLMRINTCPCPNISLETEASKIQNSKLKYREVHKYTPLSKIDTSRLTEFIEISSVPP